MPQSKDVHACTHIYVQLYPLYILYIGESIWTDPRPALSSVTDDVEFCNIGGLENFGN